MTQKPILVPARLQRLPKTGWSWVDRRFVPEHIAYLARGRALVFLPGSCGRQTWAFVL